MQKIRENKKIKIIDEDGLFDLIRTSKAQVIPESPSKKSPSKKSSSSIPKPISLSQEALIEGEAQLWADKWKPKSTSDLVGNPSAIKQLKEWLSSWNVKGYGSKAALLSGPPGIGKTSAANLVAKEAGYTPVEFNASDTRSKLAIKTQVGEMVDNRGMGEFFQQKKVKIKNESS